MSIRQIIAAALSIAALVAGYYAWRDVQRQIGYDKAVSEYEKQAKKTDDKRAAVSAPIAEKHAKAVTQIRTIYKTITKEVPVYVPSDSCPLPGGFRVLHDAAANGEVPDTARVPDAASVPAQDAAATVAGNYGTCRETAQRLTDLQAWIKAQQSLN